MAYTIQQTDTGGIRLLDEASSSKGSITMSLFWDVARGATNTVTVGTLPANARITSIFVQVPVVSNAATTATVSVGLSGGSATYFSTAQDVKAAIGNFSQAATANWAVATASQAVTCTYTETGTASTAGKFSVAVNYVVV
jgi:hypothetical protein